MRRIPGALQDGAEGCSRALWCSRWECGSSDGGQKFGRRQRRVNAPAGNDGLGINGSLINAHRDMSPIKIVHRFPLTRRRSSANDCSPRRVARMSTDAHRLAQRSRGRPKSVHARRDDDSCVEQVCAWWAARTYVSDPAGGQAADARASFPPPQARQDPVFREFFDLDPVCAPREARGGQGRATSAAGAGGASTWP